MQKRGLNRQCVAGVSAPAFVERSRRAGNYVGCRLGTVSPGSRPRPSLSDLVRAAQPLRTDSVAGVSAPAFVERRSTECIQDDKLACRVAGVSAPAFVERGKARVARATWDAGGCVAGVSAPAFVERAMRSRRWRSCCCVAGVSAPAFVERRGLGPGMASVAGVSAPAFVERRLSPSEARIAAQCRRGLGPGLR